MRGLLLCALIVGGMLITPGLVAAEPTWTASHTTDVGVQFAVEFNEATERIEIVVTNPTSTEQYGAFAVNLDSAANELRKPLLQPGERRVYSFDLTSGVDLTQNEHQVEVDTGETSLKYNYTRDIVPSETQGYNTPKITNVEFESGSYNGENVTLVNVTGHNPTGRNWVLVIRAYTFETTGYYGVLGLPKNSSSSETIILNEKPGELVAGEVRMYEENISDRDKAFDQVEIYGRSSGSTEWSRESYVPITPSWRSDDHYAYTNESLHREKVGAPERLQQSPIAWVFATVAVLYVVRRVYQLRG